MKTIFLTLAVAALAGGAAAAMQPPATAQGATPRTSRVPHTVQGRMMLYEMTDYNGEASMLDSASPTVHTDWNIRSLSIHPGDRWQICARSRFRTPCIVLDRSVHDASLIGVEGQIGSARPAPPEAPQQQD